MLAVQQFPMHATLFHFLNPARDANALGPWKNVVGSFTRVLAYTSFGDFILFDPATGEHAILLTMTGEIEPTGFRDTLEFNTVFLSDTHVIEQLGKPALVTILEQRLGKLGTEEVYYPVPYPFLGGSGEPGSFEKGNVWTFASIVGQSHRQPARRP